MLIFSYSLILAVCVGRPIINKIKMAKFRKRCESGAAKKVSAQTTKRSKRGRHLKWDESSMTSAIEAVQRKTMSQRLACQTFNKPICTLQMRLNGRTKIGAKPGRPTIMTRDQEGKLVDFASNKASMGVGFGKHSFEDTQVIWPKNIIERSNMVRLRCAGGVA